MFTFVFVDNKNGHYEKGTWINVLVDKIEANLASEAADIFEAKHNINLNANPHIVFYKEQTNGT